MRRHVPLETWTFAMRGEDPIQVKLPHAWNTAPDGVPTGRDHRAVGIYRCAVAVPEIADGRRVFAEFDAAGIVAEVFVGDRHVGSHRGGYSRFRVELTEALDPDGSGELIVHVDNRPTDDVYPLQGDHTFFGGLYRPARLIVLDPLHLALGDDGGPGVIVSQRSLDDETAVVRVDTAVTNTSSDARSETVTIRLIDGDGAEVAATDVAIEIGGDTTVEVTADLDIASPRRWDGRRDPHLHRARVSVGDDTLELPFGLRTFEVDPERGALLNGRPHPLRGVARHHDVAGTPAVSVEDVAADLDLIEEMGADAVRLAHYQHGEEVLRGCDERGILVWAEIPLNSQVSPTHPVGNAESQLRELIAQQRHHPSIVCWGIQNEAMIGERAADPRPVTETLAQLARRLDPSRPTAQAQLTLVDIDDPINGLCDLNAANLYHGWYHEDAEAVGAALDTRRAANPDVPLGLSEYGADARPDYHALDPTAGDYTEEYQAIFHEIYLRAIEERPWLWCSFVWNMFDFASVIRNEGGTRGFNMKGLVTRDRRIRKDAFWWYKANWSDDPVLHLCSKRFVNRHDPDVELKVYSNLDEVIFVVDGQERAVVAPEGRVARLRIRLDAEETAVEVRSRDGAVVDRARFVLVDEADPAYLCPAPRRVRSGSMASWFEDAGVEVDRSRFGTWCSLGDLLDEPRTRAILLDEFGPRFLQHPQIEMARGFAFDFVLGAVDTGRTDDQLIALQRRLAEVPRPA